MGTDSVPFLEPAFVTDAPPALPQPGGDYRLAGRSDSGAELFSFTFDLLEVAGGDGSASFAFALPAQSGWNGSLASISLTGPGRLFTLDRYSDHPMAILRNPRTGQVRGILRAPPAGTLAAAQAPGGSAGPGLEVIFSRGIPDAAAWRRR